MPVSTEFLAASSAKFAADPRSVLARNALCSTPLESIVTSRDAVCRLHFHFSHKVPDEGKVTDQKSSGRCWLFAALNVLRHGLIRKLKLEPDFELSQAYLQFWDKLEKANWFLQNMIELAFEPVDGRLVHYLLGSPLNDGGQWDMVVALIEKYGVVPKSVFPESEYAGNTARLNAFLTSKLREWARQLRGMAAEARPYEALVEEKNKMLTVVHHALLMAFGEPPTRFTWTYRDTDKKFVSLPDLTPRGFAEAHMLGSLQASVSIINDPRNPYWTTYSVDRLGNVVGGRPVLYLNLPIEELRGLSVATVKEGLPVWFGCDVGKFLHRKLGVMDPAMFDYTALFGTTPSMSKADRLVFGESAMTHAMVLTGFDSVDEGATVSKWRVENSWGDKDGDKGFYSMSDAWLSEFVYQVVVDRTRLSERARAALAGPPTIYPAWDPMGSLA